MRMLISGFSPAKELGTRANQKISGYNWIRVDGWKRFEYAACGRKNFRVRKKIIAEKKIPDTCRHGLIPFSTPDPSRWLAQKRRALGSRMGLILVQFSALIVIIISTRVVFLRLWRHLLHFSFGNTYCARKCKKKWISTIWSQWHFKNWYCQNV